LLGENLLRDEVTALLELVKNAHDADATNCTVRFESLLTDAPRIIVEDDGVGMDASVVSTAWMEPGTSYKQRKPVTLRGRRVQGEKGIGRFAVDKIARRLDMYTRSEDMTDVIHFTVDWGEFDDADRYLEDVKAQYSFEKTQFGKHGTTLVLTKLRKSWNRYDVERARYGLIRLVPPSGLPDQFVINLEVPEYPDLEGIVRNDIIHRAPFRISAELKDGSVQATIYRNLKWDISTRNKEITVHRFQGEGIIQTEELKNLGPITINIGAFLRTKTRGRPPITLFPPVTISQADAEILEQWHGVSIYSDGFWIYPYGENWYDWLALSQRRVMIPGSRFDNNQLVGFVNISRDKNPGLIQQMSREGLVHNESYELLRAVVISVVAVLESDAVASGARRGKKETVGQGEISASSSVSSMGNSFRKAEELLGEARSKIESGATVDSLRDLTTAKNVIGLLRQEVEQSMVVYDRLAVLGQFVSYVIHEISLAIDPLRLTLDTIRNVLSSTSSLDTMVRQRAFALLEKTDSDVEDLAAELEKWSPFIGKKGVKERIELCQYMRELHPDLAQTYPRMKIDLICKEPITLEGNRADLWTIVRNLVDNSSYWTRDVSEPLVKITVFKNDSSAIVRVSDNGRGVPEEERDNIFVFGWSAKPDGSGLGLKLAGEAAANLGGELVFLPMSELGNGATFELRLPLGGRA